VLIQLKIGIMICFNTIPSSLKKTYYVIDTSWIEGFEHDQFLLDSNVPFRDFAGCPVDCPSLCKKVYARAAKIPLWSSESGHFGLVGDS
jgi:hypothetical protein